MRLVLSTIDSPLSPLSSLVLNPVQTPVALYLQRLAPSSRQTMRYVLQEAADRLGAEDVAIDEFPWHQLQPGHITALVAALREDGYAPNTSSLHVNAIRGVMNQAWQQNLITQDHLLKIRAVKAGGGSRLVKGRNLRRNLIRELMDVCAADPRPQGLRDAAIIAILYGSGMRKSESVNMDLWQVDVEQRSLQVLGKGNKELIKFAPAWAFEKLEEWLAFRRANLPDGVSDDTFLFNRIRRGNHITRDRLTKHAIYYIAKQRGRQAGVDIMPHDFRRSFITRVIEEYDVSIAQKLAHHANIATTVSYDVRDDNERRNVTDRFLL